MSLLNFLKAENTITEDHLSNLLLNPSSADHISLLIYCCVRRGQISLYTPFSNYQSPLDLKNVTFVGFSRSTALQLIDSLYHPNERPEAISARIIGRKQRSKKPSWQKPFPCLVLMGKRDPKTIRRPYVFLISQVIVKADVENENPNERFCCAQRLLKKLYSELIDPAPIT